jgi:hypothetical protein
MIGLVRIWLPSRLQQPLFAAHHWRILRRTLNGTNVACGRKPAWLAGWTGYLVAGLPASGCSDTGEAACLLPASADRWRWPLQCAPT